jgi:hypothetical protein
MSENGVWVGQVRDGFPEAVRSLPADRKDHSYLPAPHTNMWRFSEEHGIVGWWEPWTAEMQFAVDEFLLNRGHTVKQHAPLVTKNGIQVRNGQLKQREIAQLDMRVYTKCHFNQMLRITPAAQWDRWQKDQSHYHS